MDVAGVLWFAFTLNAANPLRAARAAVETALYPFVLADIVKVFIAAGTLPGLWWLTRAGLSRS